jgi:glucose/arabinose dehydrogenase
MYMSPKGTLFVSTLRLGRVYAVKDPFGKKEVVTIAQGLTMPNGIAMKDGALIVVANSKVLRYDDIENRLDNPPAPVDISEKFRLPSDQSHGWRYIAFGPDGKLYIPVGANCNICELNPGIHGNIRRYDADGSNMEIVARGVRNTVGFDWHPTTGELWFSDNGRDWAGNEGPDDELNRLPKGKEGAFFGYPYCHANGIPDPDIRKADPCAGVTLPAATTGPHSASLGVKFYTGSMFPAKYRNVAFVARHGSWNREQKFGYDIVTATPTANGKAKIEPFLTGLLDTAKNEGVARPVAGRCCGPTTSTARFIAFPTPASRARRWRSERRREASRDEMDASHRAGVRFTDLRRGRADCGRTHPDMRRLPWRGRQFENRAHSLPRRPAGDVPAQSTGVHPRGRAADSGDAGGGEGPEGRGHPGDRGLFRQAAGESQR